MERLNGNIFWFLRLFMEILVGVEMIRWVKLCLVSESFFENFFYIIELLLFSKIFSFG